MPKRVPVYDLLGMPDTDFELMCSRLIRLEFPGAFKPADTKDGGADTVLPRTSGGYERAWQAKHFRGQVPWTRCRESLASATKNWAGISEYTFCFPRTLTAAEQKTFDGHFRGDDQTVVVNLWNGEALQARLVGSPPGQRVARTFFADVEADHEQMMRAVESAGRLDSHQDVLDRLGNISGALQTRDAYFSYPTATHEADMPGPGPTEGAVMSLESINAEGVRRIDVVPRDSEAMTEHGPELRIQPADDEHGPAAMEALDAALRGGRSVDIEEGLDVTFTRLPPAFAELEGERLSGGRVRIGDGPAEDRPVLPWNARMHIRSDRGEETINILLEPTDDVPEGWDHAKVGASGGLTIMALSRWLGDTRTGRGEMRWNFTHRRDASPTPDQLKALRFLRATTGTGELVVTDTGGTGRPEFRAAIDRPATDRPTGDDTPEADVTAEEREIDLLLCVFEDLVAIEEWAGMALPTPQTITAEQMRNVAQVAQIVRHGGRPLNWTHLSFVVPEGQVAPLREGKPLRIEQQASGALFGHRFELGNTRLDLNDYRLVSIEPAADEPGRVLIRLEPGSPEDAEVFESLTKSSTMAKPMRRPPPPPPRGHDRGKRRRGTKGKRKGGGKRKRRGR